MQEGYRSFQASTMAVLAEKLNEFTREVEAVNHSDTDQACKYQLIGTPTAVGSDVSVMLYVAVLDLPKIEEEDK